ncbi:MAG: hypothetical protein M1833_007175 [Piccolia ochrophora]|nr:MAG: hypothetical protein M1833_007175 [Piccolia ochrophora]
MLGRLILRASILIILAKASVGHDGGRPGRERRAITTSPSPPSPSSKLTDARVPTPEFVGTKVYDIPNLSVGINGPILTAAPRASKSPAAAQVGSLDLLSSSLAPHEPGIIVDSSRPSAHKDGRTSGAESVSSSAGARPSVGAETTSSVPNSTSSNSENKVVIIISIICSAVILGIIGSLIVLFRRRRRGRKLFGKRNTVTPIDDEEIESWRVEPSNRPSVVTAHRRSSVQKPMVIEKPVPPRPSKTSAPNARTGLTDSTVPGEEPFVLPTSPRRHSIKRPKSSRHISGVSSISYGPTPAYSPREAGLEEVERPPSVPQVRDFDFDFGLGEGGARTG